MTEESLAPPYDVLHRKPRAGRYGFAKAARA